MDEQTLEKFRELLKQRREEILGQAKQTLRDDMEMSIDDMPDEMDQASSEYSQAMVFRLRGREKTLLQKIDKAIQRMADGEFGLCEECGEEISVKRLEARPVTTLCIRCKEEQERREKDFV